MGSKMDEVKGRAKQAAGVAADDPKLEREGKVDRAGAAVKDKAERAKDAVSDVVDTAKAKINARH